MYRVWKDHRLYNRVEFEGDPSNPNYMRLVPLKRNFKLGVKLKSWVRLYKAFKFSYKHLIQII